MTCIPHGHRHFRVIHLRFHYMGGHFPLSDLGLGIFLPSKARKVENMNTFIFDKDSSKIVLQKTRNLPMTRKSPLWVTTETNVTKN
jgi:hypothetical protein